MRTTFFNLIFLFAIVGCKQPTINKVQQAVEAQAKLFVDSGLIVNEYVILYELAINDSNHIYRIQAADSCISQLTGNIMRKWACMLWNTAST